MRRSPISFRFRVEGLGLRVYGGADLGSKLYGLRVLQGRLGRGGNMDSDSVLVYYCVGGNLEAME